MSDGPEGTTLGICLGIRLARLPLHDVHVGSSFNDGLVALLVVCCLLVLSSPPAAERSRPSRA